MFWKGFFDGLFMQIFKFTAAIDSVLDIFLVLGIIWIPAWNDPRLNIFGKLFLELPIAIIFQIEEAFGETQQNKQLSALTIWRIYHFRELLTGCTIDFLLKWRSIQLYAIVTVGLRWNSVHFSDCGLFLEQGWVKGSIIDSFGCVGSLGIVLG